MGEYEKQRMLFISVLDKIHGLSEELTSMGIKAKIPVWSDDKCIGGFPNRFNIELNLEDITTASIWVNCCSQFDGMESITIEQIDTIKAKQGKHYGTRVIEAIKLIAEAVDVKRISGTIFTKEDGYSSEGFYQKCGFATNGVIFSLEIH